MTTGNSIFHFFFKVKYVNLSLEKIIRYYVISRLRKLTQLDSSPVTDEERRKAVELYGSLASSVAFEEREREREQQARQAREEEKRNLERTEKERRKV